jgi:hypothetical protein
MITYFGHDIVGADEQHAASAIVGRGSDTDVQDTVLEAILPAAELISNAVGMVQVAVSACFRLSGFMWSCGSAMRATMRWFSSTEANVGSCLTGGVIFAASSATTIEPTPNRHEAATVAMK